MKHEISGLSTPNMDSKLESKIVFEANAYYSRDWRWIKVDNQPDTTNVSSSELETHNHNLPFNRFNMNQIFYRRDQWVAQFGLSVIGTRTRTVSKNTRARTSNHPTSKVRFITSNLIDLEKLSSIIRITSINEK